MRRILPAYLLLIVLQACVSGKSALQHGNYYEAVIESINRLRSSPENKKAITVLQQGYPLAIEYIDTNIKNSIDADDPMKWRNAVKGYNQINYLSDQISTSVGAKKIISKPVTRYAELKDVKVKAAEESYQAGITAMMKNTREDAKTAYFDFKGATDLEPGYRESLEMMNQAEYIATLRVAYFEENASNINYPGSVQIINSLRRQFLSFKPIGTKDTVPPHQVLKIVYVSFTMDYPRTTTRTDNVSKDVKVGERKDAAGKTQDVMQTVNAKITYYHKERRASSNMQFTIYDGSSNTVLTTEQVIGDGSWVYDWATYSGDIRALSADQQSISRNREAFPNDQNQLNLSIRNVQNSLSRQLQNYYSSY